MCLYANSFVSGKTKETLNLPEFPSRIYASTDHEVHSGFQNQFGENEGIFLTFHDGHCLCQFQDWEKLLDFVDQIRQVNGLDSIPLMIFWSSAEYEEISSTDIDLELDRISGKPAEGVLLRVGISIKRRLAKYVGNEARILFKSGKEFVGSLEEYRETEDYGLIRTETEAIYFNSLEIKDIQKVPST